MALKFVILCSIIALTASAAIEHSSENFDENNDHETQESGIHKIISKPPAEFLLHPENFNNFEALPYEPHSYLPEFIRIPQTSYGVPDLEIHEPAPAPVPVPVPAPAPASVSISAPIQALIPGLTIDPSIAIPKPDVLYLLESLITLLGNLVVKLQVAFNNNYEFIKNIINLVISKISFIHVALLNIISTIRKVLEFLAVLFSSIKTPLATINAGIGHFVAPPPAAPHLEYGVPH